MTVMPILLCIIFLTVPIFELVGIINGFDFVIANDILTVSIQAFFALAALVTLFVLKPECKTAEKIFLLLLPPISLLNAFCFLDTEWKFSILVAVFSAVCVFVIYAKFVPDSGFKATSAVFSVFIAIVIVVIYLWNLFAGFLVTKEVANTITSINGTYSATVYSEENPLSSKACVEVTKNTPEQNVFIGSYFKKSKIVFEGEAYQAKTATIFWKDDATIVVGNIDYNVE
jgi:hypothetical protein